jgi:hypothetical protein
MGSRINSKIKTKIKTKINGDAQECPGLGICYFMAAPDLNSTRIPSTGVSPMFSGLCV